MRRIRPPLLIPTLAFALWLDLTPHAQAQGFLGRETIRQLQPGVPITHDGMSYAQRYHYGAGIQTFFPYCDYGRYRYIEYLDRLDRSEKFGHRLPDLPPGIPRSWGPAPHKQVFIRLYPPPHP